MQDLDATAVVADFGGNYTVTRSLSATYDGGGMATPDAEPTTLTILGVFWPTMGRRLMRLPEGRRSEADMEGVSLTELFVGGAGSAHEADVVTIDGVRWEVSSSAPWPNLPGFWVIELNRPNEP